jgi:hypothetical protein
MGPIKYKTVPITKFTDYKIGSKIVWIHPHIPEYWHLECVIDINTPEKRIKIELLDSWDPQILKDYKNKPWWEPARGCLNTHLVTGPNGFIKALRKWKEINFPLPLD